MLQAVFKMSAFSIDTRCQPTTPLINSKANNVLLQISPDWLRRLPNAAEVSKISWRSMWRIYDIIQTTEYCRVRTYSCFHGYKKCKNWPRNGRVIVEDKVALFLWLTVYTFTARNEAYYASQHRNHSTLDNESDIMTNRHTCRNHSMFGHQRHLMWYVFSQ